MFFPILSSSQRTEKIYPKIYCVTDEPWQCAPHVEAVPNLPIHPEALAGLFEIRRYKSQMNVEWTPRSLREIMTFLDIIDQGWKSHARYIIITNNIELKLTSLMIPIGAEIASLSTTVSGTSPIIHCRSWKESLLFSRKAMKVILTSGIRKSLCNLSNLLNMMCCADYEQRSRSSLSCQLWAYDIPIEHSSYSNGSDRSQVIEEDTMRVAMQSKIRVVNPKTNADRYMRRMSRKFRAQIFSNGWSRLSNALEKGCESPMHVEYIQEMINSSIGCQYNVESVIVGKVYREDGIIPCCSSGLVLLYCSSGSFVCHSEMIDIELNKNDLVMMLSERFVDCVLNLNEVNSRLHLYFISPKY